MLLNLSYLLSALAATGICVLTGGFSGFGTGVLWLLLLTVKQNLSGNQKSADYPYQAL